MKTNLVEIFQTIRASLQPYAAMGFDADKNSENEYALVTEKGQKIDAIFFASVIIVADQVEFCLFRAQDAADIDPHLKPTLKALKASNGCFSITELDNKGLDNIEWALSEGFKIYKEKGWV